MKQVFLVTAGEYSDYRIVAAFSRKDLAEAFCEEYNKPSESKWKWDDAEVEELPLDRPPSEWVQITVWMDKDGNQPHEPVVEVGEVEAEVEFVPRGVMVSRVYTSDIEKAVKVSNERRARLLAEGKWGRKFASGGVSAGND